MRIFRYSLLLFFLFSSLRFVSSIPEIKVIDFAINGIRNGILVYNDKEHCYLPKEQGKYLQTECVQEIRQCFFVKNTFYCLK